MKKFARFISLALVVLMAFGMANVGLAGDIKGSESNDVIRFGSDGKLKIMHITDSHITSNNADASMWLIGKALDKEQPDVAVVTGDNINPGEGWEKVQEFVDRYMELFESRGIPVAVTFGNHDSETGLFTRDQLLERYNRFSCSLARADVQPLSGSGTYFVPVYGSKDNSVKFNLWVFDSNDYDAAGNYSCVQKDQVDWYKATSDMLKIANGGEKVYSFAFQHIIVPEIYDVLKKVDKPGAFIYERIYTDGEYYTFDPNSTNYGTLYEEPCCGYENFGQFDAMVEKGDVIAVFSGHEHTNNFAVNNQGIDIVNSGSCRYNGDAYSAQYGYRIIEVDENDPSKYQTRVEKWYDMFTWGEVFSLKTAGDDLGFETALNVTFQGFFQKGWNNFYIAVVELFTGRQVSYPHSK